MISREPDRNSIFMWCWTTILLPAFIFGWLYMLFGKVELQFAPAELVHRRILFGMARTKTYQAGHIYSPFFELYYGHRGRTCTAISFYYDGKLVRVCDGIEQPDAKELIDSVVRQMPALATTWGKYAEGVPVRERDGDVALKLK